jgi:hypothetical protein
MKIIVFGNTTMGVETPIPPIVMNAAAIGTPPRRIRAEHWTFNAKSNRGFVEIIGFYHKPLLRAAASDAFAPAVPTEGS